MTTSQEARIANRKHVLDVIESITTDSSIKRPDLAEAVPDALEDAELIVPSGYHKVQLSRFMRGHTDVNPDTAWRLLAVCGLRLNIEILPAKSEES